MCIDCVGISNIEWGHGGNFQDDTSKVVGHGILGNFSTDQMVIELIKISK